MMALRDVIGFVVSAGAFLAICAAAYLVIKNTGKPSASANKELRDQLLAAGVEPADRQLFTKELPWSGVARCDARIGERPYAFLYAPASKHMPRTASMVAALGNKQSSAPETLQASFMGRPFQIWGMSLSLGKSVSTGDAAFDKEFFVYLPTAPAQFRVPEALRAVLLKHGRSFSVGVSAGYGYISWQSWAIDRATMGAAIEIFNVLRAVNGELFP